MLAAGSPLGHFTDYCQVPDVTKLKNSKLESTKRVQISAKVAHLLVLDKQ